MSINNFIPEIWAAELLEARVRATKFASPLVVNRDYEGEILQAGDTVHITSLNEPTVATYARGGTLTYENLVDAGADLVISQSKEFSFALDDLDKRQSVNGGKMMASAAAKGAKAIARVADAYVQALLESDVASANKIGATAITSSALAVARLVAHKQMLDENDVPEDGRYTIVPSWFHSLLVLDDRFMAYDAATNGNRLVNGAVGRALGFEIVQANYALSTGDDWYVYSGHPDAVTFADQINEVEAVRLQTTFGDGLRGLHLYGAKVLRPSEICMTLCSVT